MQAMGAVLDAPTASILGAIVAAWALIGVKLIPRTKSEAAVDIATARDKDGEAWARLVASLEKAVERLERELETERSARQHVEKVAALLERRVAELESA